MRRLFFISLILYSSSFAMAQQTKDPGAELSLTAAAQTGEAFCVATFQELGTPDVGSPGHTYFANAVIKVSRNLRAGDFEITRCSYSVRTFPPELAEVAPVAGKPFLMIGVIENGTFKITKLTEPSAENLPVVEKALRARNLPVNSRSSDPQASDLHPEPAADVTRSKPSPPSKSSTAVATPVPSSPSPILAENPSSGVGRSSPTWPWLIGILALVVIVGLVLKRDR